MQARLKGEPGKETARCPATHGDGVRLPVRAAPSPVNKKKGRYDKMSDELVKEIKDAAMALAVVAIVVGLALLVGGK